MCRVCVSVRKHTDLRLSVTVCFGSRSSERERESVCVCVVCVTKCQCLLFVRPSCSQCRMKYRNWEILELFPFFPGKSGNHNAMTE